MKKSVHLLVRAALLSLAICAIPFIAQSAAATQSSMLPMVTTLKASRLDAHDGQMKQNAKNLMAYKNDDCTGQLNHYIVSGDWYNIDTVCSNSTRQIHYPITVKNGNNDTTEDHYFSGEDFLANSDGSVGTFKVSLDQTKWYNSFPTNASSLITYTDDCSDNGAQIYISNNKKFSVVTGAYNNKLCCADGNTIMSAPTTPSTFCYYDHGDYANADYSWTRAKQGWCKTWLIEGTNTVYFAGTDASGNYATSSASFKYDTVKPYCNKPTLKSIKTSGFTAYVDVVGDATSGVASVTFKVYTKADKSDIKMYSPIDQGGGAWCCSVSTSDFSSTATTYVIVADVVDNAGNSFEITSNGTVPTTTSSTVSSSSTSSTISDYTPTCDFELDTPIKVNAATNPWWTSDAGSKLDHIDVVKFSISSDGGNTWSDETLKPPYSFDTVGKYEVRMRAHAYICDKWSDYAEHDVIVYDLPVAPTALFTVTSPVAVGTQLNIADSSHVNSASDKLGTYEWSYSIDDKTWTTLSSAPDSFDLSEFSSTTLYATYYIRLRVETQGSDYVASIWSTYCEQSVVVYRVNTAPSALFNVNSSYKALDTSEKTVKGIYTGYDSSGNVSTYYRMTDGTIKQLVGGSTSPLIDNDLYDASDISVNGEYLYAIMSDGSIIAKDTVSSNTATQAISGASSVVSVGNSTYAIFSDGSVYYKKTDCTSGGWSKLSLSGVSQIVVNQAIGVSAARTSSGSVYYWYDYNSSVTTKFSPVLYCSSAKYIASGGSSTSSVISVLKSDNTVSYMTISSGTVAAVSYSISGVSNPTKIYAGIYFYVVDSSGNVYSNMSGSMAQFGQLSDVSDLSVACNPSYAGYDSVTSTDAAYVDTVYSLSSSGNVKVWGANPTVYDGTNYLKYQIVPNDIAFLLQSRVVSLSAGGYGVSAVMSDGSIKAWGDNTNNYLGYADLGSSAKMSTPESVNYKLYNGFQNVNSIVSPEYSSSIYNFSNLLGIFNYSNASYLISGSGNIYQDGTNIENQWMTQQNSTVSTCHDSKYQNSGKQLYIGKNAAKVASSTSNNNMYLVLKNDGTLAHSYADIHVDAALASASAWSNNSYGSGTLNDNYYIQDYFAADAPNYNVTGDIGTTKITAKDIAFANGLFYVLSTEGKVYNYTFATQETKCTVYNESGTTALGERYYLQQVTNNIVDSYATFTYTGMSGVSSIYDTNGYLAGLTSAGKVLSYNGSSVTDLGLNNIMQVSGSSNFGMALTTTGYVYTWGTNTDGELGQGNTTSLTTPTMISGLKNITSIAAGTSSAYAICNDSNVYSWGDNAYAELGNGGFTDLTTPTVIPYFSYGTTIAAVFPTETLNYSDLSSADDYWDSIVNDEWQYSFDASTWISGKPTSFSWSDLGGEKYKVVYIRRRVTDVGNSPYSPGITTPWLVEKVMLCDPRPSADSLNVNEYDYEESTTSYWIKQGNNLSTTQQGDFPSVFLFNPDTTYLGLYLDGVYSSGSTPEQSANESSVTRDGSLYSTYFTNLSSIAGLAVVNGSCLASNQIFGTLKDGTNALLNSKYSFTSVDSGNTYITDGGYQDSNLYVHVDGRAPTGSAVMTSTDIYTTVRGASGNLVNRYSYTNYVITATNISDNNGSGVNNLYADIYDSDSKTTSRVSLTNNGNNNWSITELSYYDLIVLKDVYAVDNVGNSALLYSSNLTIGATLAPNPAKQGEQVTFTMVTTGSPNDIDIAFPSAIYSLDNTISSGTVSIPVSGNGSQLTTAYNYTLPSNTPPTFDADGNRLLNPYSFTITAKDASGNTASCQVTLDVEAKASGNITGTLNVSDHYYENTNVTGAVNISYTSSDSTADLIPSSGVTVQITAGSTVITKTILCPVNKTSWIPFEFHTPSVTSGSSAPLTISVAINPSNVLTETNYTDNDISKQITIDSAAYTEPTSTCYEPTAPSTWQGSSPGNYNSTNSCTWQEWRYENTALTLKNFYVNASSAMQLTPDTRIASSKLIDGIWTMGSGYGFTNHTAIHVTTNYDQSDLITMPQRIRAYFPEFDYDMQNNLTELEAVSQTGTTSDYTINYAFKQNLQSNVLARLHFTPLWFPNSSYIVLENARDLWTPSGQINMWGSYKMNISGSVYDDWNASIFPNK